MAALESVMQMKEQGMPESQIIQSLKEQGISPKEINEALSQSKIKSAIHTSEELPRPPAQDMTTSLTNNIPVSRDMNPELNQQMQPSMMQSIPSQQISAPMPQDFSSQSSVIPQQPSEAVSQQSMQYPESYPPQDYSQTYSPEGYSEQYYSQSSDIETINEIAEQIVDEKTEKLKKQISSVERFKQEITPELKRITERLEKLENVFNELQVAILKKIGDYGEDLKNISNEMHATHDTFSKMVNPVLDSQRNSDVSLKEGFVSEESSSSERSDVSKPKRGRPKKEPDFESYLR